LHKLDKVEQPSSFMLLYAMAIHFALTSANGKSLAPVCTSKVCQLHELEHGRRRELGLKLPKGFVARLIPLLE
jgi:hypothetical protein